MNGTVLPTKADRKATVNNKRENNMLTHCYFSFLQLFQFAFS